MDERTQDLVDLVRDFLREVVNREQLPDGALSPFGERVQEHLGVPVSDLPVITHEVPSHRLVDADIALASLAARDGHAGRSDDEAAEPIGLTGGQMREQFALPELLAASPHVRVAVGPVDYVSIADGPDSTRRVVSFGAYLLHFDGHPLVALQRAARPERGRSTATIEVVTARPEVASAFIEALTKAMLDLSVLRGKVLSFTGNEYGHGAAGAMFLPRPEVAADEVVLGPGVLESVARHVVGVGEHRDRLRRAGRHLKRGVLLYGPPGTGKTLTVRHLLSRTPQTTAVLLTGSSIRFITEAAELARAMQPAMVVLEDVDLIAHERGMYGPQPLLFAVLDALDGLDGDADVAFVMTTNRVEVLERALAERPGRVDLAVEIPLPDDESRRRLFHRYADGLALSAPALDAAADRARGTTGSFAKELMRRAVLLAAEDGRDVGDADLAAALDGLLESSARLTRSLLGGADGDPAPAPDDDGRDGHGETGSVGWVAYSPNSGMSFPG